MEEKSQNTIETRADFTRIRYASCWEDADVLVHALDPKAGEEILSIASGGDNSLALLAGGPQRVIAIDLNPAQLACTELKKEAMRLLSYEETLQFLGVIGCSHRRSYYQKLKNRLTDEVREFWNQNVDLIDQGIIHVGKFENYFRLFRTYCLPLIHSKKRVKQLMEPKEEAERLNFYEKRWNNLRWRLLFKFFFGRKMMGKLGRDAEFFKYVETSVADRILARAKYALSVLPTDTNPYLEYIVKGNFAKNLPFYLRRENFEAIRGNLDRLELFKGGLDEVFQTYPSVRFSGFNLSDIFEYMSKEQYAKELGRIVRRAKPGAKIAFWNMLAERKEVADLESHISFLTDKAEALHRKDKAFFYQSFVLGEVK